VQDLYPRLPVHKAGFAPSAKAKDRLRLPFLGASSPGGSRACVAPSRADFADRRRLRLIGAIVRSMHGKGPKELDGRCDCNLSSLTELAV
jgi:hypothetical protein